MRTQRYTVRRTTRDSNGDPLPVSSHDIAAVTAPRSSGEDDDRGRSVIVGLELFAPDPEADIRAADQVLIAGTVWDVVGEPGRWVSPHTGRPAGLQVALARRDG